jgi:hypothetical protein
MQIEKRAMLPWVFYMLVSTITAAIFVLPAGLGFLVANIGDDLTVILITATFLFRGPVVGIASIFAKQFSREIHLKVIGANHARLVGALVGGILGGVIAKLIGGIIGALLFYFLGRWIGPKVSTAIANWIERYYNVPEIHRDRVPAEGRGIFPTAYFLVLPFVFIFLVLLLNRNYILVDFPPEYLPVARGIAILLSIVSIGAPWLLKGQILREAQKKQVAPPDFLFLGVGFSLPPMIYGFLLFLFGASIPEFIAFAMVSEIASVLWLVYESRQRLKKFSQAEFEEDRIDQDDIGM